MSRKERVFALVRNAVFLSLTTWLALCYNQANNSTAGAKNMSEGLWIAVIGVGGIIIAEVLKALLYDRKQYNNLSKRLGEFKETSAYAAIGVKAGEASLSQRVGIESGERSLAARLGVKDDVPSLAAQIGVKSGDLSLAKMTASLLGYATAQHDNRVTAEKAGAHDLSFALGIIELWQENVAKTQRTQAEKIAKLEAANAELVKENRELRQEQSRTAKKGPSL